VQNKSAASLAGRLETCLEFHGASAGCFKSVIILLYTLEGQSFSWFAL